VDDWLDAPCVWLILAESHLARWHRGFRIFGAPIVKHWCRFEPRGGNQLFSWFSGGGTGEKDTDTASRVARATLKPSSRTRPTTTTKNRGPTGNRSSASAGASLSLNSEVGHRYRRTAGVGQTLLSASWGDFPVAQAGLESPANRQAGQPARHYLAPYPRPQLRDSG
jgi:hypothetical protein